MAELCYTAGHLISSCQAWLKGETLELSPLSWGKRGELWHNWGRWGTRILTCSSSCV